MSNRTVEVTLRHARDTWIVESNSQLLKAELQSVFQFNLEQTIADTYRDLVEMCVLAGAESLVLIVEDDTPLNRKRLAAPKEGELMTRLTHDTTSRFGRVSVVPRALDTETVHFSSPGHLALGQFLFGLLGILDLNPHISRLKIEVGPSLEQRKALAAA